MAVLNIRGLDEDVHARLRVRAAKAGRSMEAEAREIIADAVAKSEGVLHPSKLQELVDHLYGVYRPVGVVDALIAERREESARE